MANVNEQGVKIHSKQNEHKQLDFDPCMARKIIKLIDVHILVKLHCVGVVSHHVVFGTTSQPWTEATPISDFLRYFVPQVPINGEYSSNFSREIIFSQNQAMFNVIQDELVGFT